jgi:hypothetical protein
MSTCQRATTVAARCRFWAIVERTPYNKDRVSPAFDARCIIDCSRRSQGHSEVAPIQRHVHETPNSGSLGVLPKRAIGSTQTVPPISFGGHRRNSRRTVPSAVAELSFTSDSLDCLGWRQIVTRIVNNSVNQQQGSTTTERFEHHYDNRNYGS